MKFKEGDMIFCIKSGDYDDEETNIIPKEGEFYKVIRECKSVHRWIYISNSNGIDSDNAWNEDLFELSEAIDLGDLNCISDVKRKDGTLKSYIQSGNTIEFNSAKCIFLLYEYIKNIVLMDDGMFNYEEGMSMDRIINGTTDQTEYWRLLYLFGQKEEINELIREVLQDRENGKENRYGVQ